MGVEEDFFWKSYKLKVWHRFQNHNFITYKKGHLTSNLGLKNVGSLTFCTKGVLINIFLFYKKKIIEVKKFQKSLFHKKNFFLKVNLKNVVKQKRCTRAILVAEKKFNQKKSKLKVWHSYRKNSLNLTSETQKSVIFNFVFWEVFLHAVSTQLKL